MILYKPTKIQWLTAVFPLPLVVVFFLYLLIDFSVMSDQKLILLLLLFIPISLFSWYTCVIINNFITQKLPGQSQTIKRGIVLFIVHFIWLIALSSLIFGGLVQTRLLGVNFLQENLLTAILLGGVFNIIFTIIWQVEYIFHGLETTLAEKEKIEQELLQQEFDRLKQQLNPHFLFNNLNVLSSLISQDSAKASYYLDELSKVYRYLLRRNNEDFAPLNKELAFIRSYAVLMNIRFGNAVQITIEEDEAISLRLLPALSLQLLVENAIKHNTANRMAPLKIQIKVINNSFIEVINNLQPKKTSIPSNRIGLANIQSKYRMLNIKSMRINKTESHFEVRLPLIKTDTKTSTYEYTNYRR